MTIEPYVILDFGERRVVATGDTESRRFEFERLDQDALKQPKWVGYGVITQSSGEPSGFGSSLSVSQLAALFVNVLDQLNDAKQTNTDLQTRLDAGGDVLEPIKR